MFIDFRDGQAVAAMQTSSETFGPQRHFRVGAIGIVWDADHQLRRIPFPDCPFDGVPIGADFADNRALWFGSSGNGITYGDTDAPFAEVESEHPSGSSLAAWNVYTSHESSVPGAGAQRTQIDAEKFGRRLVALFPGRVEYDIWCRRYIEPCVGRYFLFQLAG